MINPVDKTTLSAKNLKLFLCQNVLWFSVCTQGFLILPAAQRLDQDEVKL